MELEPSSAEHSPPYSDNNRSWSWNQITDEVSSFTDSNNELCGLMEDKEVAARAVAFVVNSTRKGIVPLCADVANLMRTKQCLERKLRILRRQNDAFRSSCNGGSVPSHSMSPTPPSLSSYTEQCIKSLQEQSLAIQEHFRSSSRCSNSSSSYSYSPKLDKNKVGLYNYSPKLDKPCGGSLRPIGVQYSPASSTDSKQHGSPRFVSDFVSVKLNAKLEEDLTEARKEIDQLKKRLKRMESSGAIPKTYDQNEAEKVIEDNGYYTGSNRTSRTGSEHERISLFKKPPAKRQAITSVSYVGTLPNCKCSTCIDALGSEDDLTHYSDVYLDEPHRYAVNSKLQVQLDDHVTTKGGYSGHIRYIGHVDKIDQSHALFVGIELDTAAGTSDGSHVGKRYFYCRKDYGMFIPLTDVIGKVNKKSLLKATKEEILKLKKSSKRIKDEKITHL
ncbi:uncharacterized protein LOC132718302 [Ruditapes philippinarum]|uniref:uncharacterized protein LOC132718302 n=1 Tax=Ruditapes philippinarum TaxID=129788 RepID=UPI00295BB3C6|nr:uncharacterized protein LOC132718302 [Ruditapes philippinarum]